MQSTIYNNNNISSNYKSSNHEWGEWSASKSKRHQGILVGRVSRLQSEGQYEAVRTTGNIGLSPSQFASMFLDDGTTAATSSSTTTSTSGGSSSATGTSPMETVEEDSKNEHQNKEKNDDDIKTTNQFQNKRERLRSLCHGTRSMLEKSYAGGEEISVLYTGTSDKNQQETTNNTIEQQQAEQHH